MGEEKQLVFKKVNKNCKFSPPSFLIKIHGPQFQPRQKTNNLEIYHGFDGLKDFSFGPF